MSISSSKRNRLDRAKTGGQNWKIVAQGDVFSKSVLSNIGSKRVTQINFDLILAVYAQF